FPTHAARASSMLRPAICQVDLNLTTERPLRADRKHIGDDQHSNHQHWIDRRSAQRRVVAPELRVDPREVQHTRDVAHAAIGRNHLSNQRLLHQNLPTPAMAPFRVPAKMMYLTRRAEVLYYRPSAREDHILLCDHVARGRVACAHSKEKI